MMDYDDYLVYRRNKSVKTSEDIYNLIKMFPGISFTEIMKTTPYSGGNLCYHLRRLRNRVLKVKIVGRSFEGRGGRGTNGNNKSLYFTKEYYDKINNFSEG